MTGLVLRAYPRRWRESHGRELQDLLVELYGDDGPGVRGRLDLVRAGWGIRWRGRPPLWRYLLYRLLEVPLPQRWRGWAEDDIQGALFPVRDGLTRAWVLLPFLVVSPGMVSVLWGLGALGALTALTWPWSRRRARARLEPRSALPLSPLLQLAPTGSRPRPRLVAGTTLRLAWVLGAVSAAAALAVALRVGVRPEMVGLGAGAFVAGLLVALLGVRQGRELLRTRPAQPHRVLCRKRWLGLVLALVAVAAPVAALVPKLAPVVAVAAVVVLLVTPFVAVLDLLARTAPTAQAPVAVRDAVQAWGGRPLTVDAPLPLWGPEALTGPDRS